MKFCDRCGWDGSSSAREEARMRHLRTIRILNEADRRRAEQWPPVAELLRGNAWELGGTTWHPEGQP